MRKDSQRLFEFQNRFQLVDVDGDCFPENQRAVVFGVSGGEIVNYREFIILQDILDDLQCVFSPWDVVVVHFGHAAHDDCFHTVKITVALEVHHHAVYVVQILVEVFYEKDFPFVIDGRFAAENAVED